MRETLAREPIPEITKLEQDLAVRAERLLGYSRLRVDLGIAGPLGQTLRSIGVEPFSPGSVQQYKDAAKKAANKLNRERFPGTMSAMEWKRIPLSEYAQRIEPAIVSRAIEIIELEPDAVFFVDELCGDPFLIVVRGEEEYYIEVWGEEGFRA